MSSKLVAGLIIPFCAMGVFGEAALSQEGEAEPTTRSYYKDIWPIVQQRCQGCHQPALKEGGLDLTSHEGLRKGGRTGPGFVTREPAKSLIVQYLIGEAEPRMPFGAEALADDEIALFREWIRSGGADDTPPEAVHRSNELPSYQLPPVITALAYSPDGAQLAVSGYRETLLHRSDGSGLEARLGGLSDRIQSIRFTPNGRTLVAAGGTPARFGELQFWNLEKQKLRKSVTVCQDTVFGATLSPDGSKVVFGCSDNTVRIVDLNTGLELHRMNHHENWVLGATFSTDGKRIVSVGRDRAAKLADASSGAFIENLNLLRGELTAVARHPSRDAVIVGGEDWLPYYYRMERPRKMVINDESTLIRQFEKQRGEILDLSFSPDGKSIAIATAFYDLSVYDVETGKRTIDCKGNKAGVYTAVFHPQRKELATGGFDGKVRIYDSDSGRLLKEFVPVPLEGEPASP